MTRRAMLSEDAPQSMVEAIFDRLRAEPTLALSQAQMPQAAASAQTLGIPTLVIRGARDKLIRRCLRGTAIYHGARYEKECQTWLMGSWWTLNGSAVRRSSRSGSTMWRWRTRFGWMLVFWAGLSATASALPLKRTDPSHMTSPPPFSVLDELERGSLPPDETGQIILLERPEAFNDIAELEQTATRSCRDRNFGERTKRRYAVQFADRVMTGGPAQVLIDIDRVAQGNKIYLFKWADTTRCTVYSVPII